MNEIETIKQEIVRWIEFFAAGVMILMVSVNFLHIFLRFIWNIPFLFISELNGYLLIWLGSIFFARSLIRTGRGLLEPDKARHSLKRRWIMSTLYEFAVFTGSVLVLFLSLKLVLIHMHYSSIIFNIPAGVFYMVLPIGAVACFLCSSLSLIELHILRKRIFHESV